MLGLACKGAAILEINKRTMKTNNIRKLVRTNYVTNVYINRDCLESVEDYFFFFVCKKKKKKKKIQFGAFFVSRSGNREHNIFSGLSSLLLTLTRPSSLLFIWPSSSTFTCIWSSSLLLTLPNSILLTWHSSILLTWPSSLLHLHGLANYYFHGLAVYYLHGPAFYYYLQGLVVNTMA